MKILTKRKQIKTYKRIAAILYILNHITIATDDDLKSLDKVIDHLADISYDIGGIKGMEKVSDLVTELYSMNNKEK